MTAEDREAVDAVLDAIERAALAAAADPAAAPPGGDKEAAARAAEDIAELRRLLEG